jgi:phospholipid transport system substrate-binding protein
MTNRRNLLLTSAAAAALGRLAPARAESAEQAAGFVRHFADRLVAIVNGPGTATEKRRKLTELLEPSVDVDGIARFCLGRHWHEASPEQQRNYVKLFHQMLTANVAAKFGEYQGVSYSTQGRARVEDDLESVPTVVYRPNNPPTNVNWIVARDTGSMKIVDVEGEGTSLRLTQRSDFASFLTHHKNSIDALINELRREVAEATIID